MDKTKTLPFSLSTSVEEALDFTINYFEARSREFGYQNSPAFSKPIKGSILIGSPKLQENKIKIKYIYFTGSEWSKDHEAWIVIRPIEESDEIHGVCIFSDVLCLHDLFGRFRLAAIRFFSRKLKSGGVQNSFKPDIFKFDVALSFSGSQRVFVREVFECLNEYGISTFYDEDQEVKIWGENLPDYLTDIYSKEARVVVIFISEDYLKSKWTNHERKAAISRAIESDSTYILPVKFDASELPGLPSTIAYLDAHENPPQILCEKIKEKIELLDKQ